MFFNKKHSKVSVLIHDGETWYAFALRRRQRDWMCFDQMTLNGRNPKQIPSALFDFAEKTNCRRIRLVLPRQVQALDIELPLDLTLEETQTILASELSQTTGSEFGSVRVVSVKAEEFQMGAMPNVLLTSEFENSLLENYGKQCGKEQLLFDGCAALELTALAVHAENASEKRFLLLRRETGFYCVGATETQPMLIGGVAVGALQNNGENSEKLERLQKRLDIHKNVPIQIVLCNAGIGGEREKQLRTIVDTETDAEFISFNGIAEKIARTVAAVDSAGEGACPVVSCGEKIIDPHYVGTWILVLSLLFAVAFAFGGKWKLENDLKAVETKAAAWKKIQNERKRLKDKLANIDAERFRCDKVIALLNEKSCTPAGLMKILTELSSNMPLYTKIEKIEQDKTGYEISGRTMYQEGLLNFSSKFNAELINISYNLELKTFEKAADNPREQIFVFRITSY
ncbi:MAG: hypothetical protein LBJ67_05440 [Planctomycetaceae bacterium]|jgi:hypothetical protein|nr:hypothetical protein [Planctomycetaceae bacterium]